MTRPSRPHARGAANQKSGLAGTPDHPDHTDAPDTPDGPDSSDLARADRVVPSGHLSACREEVRRLRAAFDSASDGIWITAGDGTVLDVNKTSLVLNRIRAEEVLGLDVRAIVGLGIVDRSATMEVLQHRRQVGFVQQAGRTGRHLFVTGVPVFGDTGEIEMVVVHERDVTDLRNMRDTMEETRRAFRKAEEELTELKLLELADRDIVAESKQMRQLLATCLKLARLDAPEVLVLGESGTGKGLLAKFLHRHGPRAAGPFIQVNCAALPPSLFEAELFGYERGAFSGAQEGRAGLLELARGGTFFLDEVGDMPQEVQAKLLKCLDEREYYPLGGREPRAVDCAIVTATNRDLERDAAGRRFRQDLYYRLSTYVVRIPPLRERPEDMLALAQRELDRLNGEFRATKRLTPVSMSLLQSHPFPGNVRELSNLLKKAVIIAEGDQLDAALAESLGTRPAFIGGETGLEEELAAVEREILLRAAARCRTTRQMAEYLGVSQPTVVRKMARHGVHLPEHGKGRPGVRVSRQ